MNQADLRRMAEERIKDAKALIRGKRWEFAYYAAGYSIECALKSCVLARMIYTAKVFEEGWKSADFRVHDFSKLIELADLGNELGARSTASRATGGMFHRHWEKVKAWKPESRYQPRTEADARALLDAITHKPDGVLRWLKNYW